MRRFVVSRPVTALCVVVIGLTLPLQLGLLVAGLQVFPGKLAELLLLTGAAALITSWVGGRNAVRHLFGGLTRWRIGVGRIGVGRIGVGRIGVGRIGVGRIGVGRIGVGRWAMLTLAMPILTIGVAAATGTLHAPDRGWAGEGLTYLVLLLLIALTASIWEETAWSGLVQRRLTDRHGLLAGSLLTAIPFGLIHLPLAFEADGWAGTTWPEAFVNWAFVLGAVPFLRYLVGIVLVDTKGSVLAAAVLHASFNASGALSMVPDGWQYVPGLIALTVLVTVHRRLRGRSLVEGIVTDAPCVDPVRATCALAAGELS